MASDTRPPTLDDLLALNAEIAALSRAGIPLEEGLAAMGKTTPGRLGAAMRRLAEHTARGEPIAQALAEPGIDLPPAYRAVVTAGLRSGRMPAALESVATSMGHAIDMRRCIVAAAWYPLLVFILGVVILAQFTRGAGPALADSFHKLQPKLAGVFSFMEWLGQSAAWWGTILPLAVVALAVLWWRASGRPAMLESFWSRALFAWLPGAARMVQCNSLATFTEMLAMLIEHQTPLPEALRLAAEAAADPRLNVAIAQLAADIERGQPARDAIRRQPTLPVMLRWWLATSLDRAPTAATLRHAAESYRSQAQERAELARLMAPILLTVFVGGGVSLVYALILFVPYASLLRSLT